MWSELVVTPVGVDLEPWTVFKVELLCYNVTLAEPHVIDSTQEKIKSTYTGFNFKKMT